ncbi:hypothetical protein ACIQXW_06105 [Lysinibacillus sp. NPDC097162]|uniref:hypothetical protein n=1 Tax=unclassified Lysinibacillus TaxID=2636778 RepID=UPI003806C7E4
MPVNPAINLKATPGATGSGEINISWNGNSDPNWSHYTMYILVSNTNEADESSPKYADITYKGNDGFGDWHSPGTRVSYALYSIMKDGSKTVQKVTVTAP